MDQTQPRFLRSKRTLLSLVVIILGFSIGFYWIHPKTFRDSQSTKYSDESATSENGRNERSTPRSFILPATPAVVFEQEMRSADKFSATMSKHQVAVCATRLIDLGYDVGDEPVAFNAKLSEAIYEYQETHGLNKSGRFDPATTRSLLCDVK